MEIKVTKNDIFWSYAAQLLNIGAGVFILPIILKKLSSAELGIWYIFLAIASLTALLDFGFLPTIQRNISYVFSGVEELLEQGISEKKSNGINYKLLKDIIETSKTIYRRISIIILILLSTLGSIYINSLIKELDNSKYIMIAWYLYIFSLIINFYYYYFNALLRGKGMIADANKITIFSRLAFILFSFLGLYFNLGLIGISLGNLASVLVIRVLSSKKFFTEELKEELKNIDSKIDKKLFRIIFHNANKLGLVSLGSFLILKGNTLIASKYLSLDIVAQYGLSLQLFTILSSIATTLLTVFIPKIVQNRIKENGEEIKEIYSMCFVLNIFIFISGVISIVYVAPYFISILGSNTKLLDRNKMLFMGGYLLLEMIHSNAATFITTRNRVPFVSSSILSGVAMVLISLFLINFTDLGLWSLLISQAVIQLLYNNWKWPLEVNKELKINFFGLWKTGIKKIIKILKGEKI